MNTTLQKIIVLDRDGVLNIDVGYTHLIEDFKLGPNVVEGLTVLKDLGFKFAIATGQSGISKGKYTLDVMHAFNNHLVEELAKHGFTVDAFVFCPHDKGEGCTCRKPGIGMLEQIEAKIGPIDWASSWGIGDKPADSKMILTMGGNAVLVESGEHNNSTGKAYWIEEPDLLAEVQANPKNFIAHDLHAAALVIQKQIA
ncbi:MAG: HAD-IIIA family hydrolase [Patescibacteria group bacterium]